MYLRLGVDPRIFLPLVMLGGLATSLALSQGPHRPSVRASAASGMLVGANGKSAETLPALLDPASSLKPVAMASSRLSFGAPNLRLGATTLPVLPNRPEPSNPGGSAPAMAPAPPGSEEEGACPAGMVLVEGDYCQVVGHVC